MSLSKDALPRASASLSVSQISVEDLDLLERDLLLFEKVSVCFLLCRKTRDFLFILEQLIKAFRWAREGAINEIPRKPLETSIISTWVRDDPEYKWREHLVEALAIVKCHKVLKKLGFDLDELRLTYQAQIDEFSVHVHLILKVLFRMCEKMSLGESHRLIRHMRSKFPNCEDFGVDSERYLELYLLNWIHSGIILIGNERKFDELLAFLKVNEMDDLYEKLKGFTTIAADATGESPKRVIQGSPEKKMKKKGNSFSLDRGNMGYALIINQMNFYREEDREDDYLFLNGNLETRHGSDRDVESLKETFSDFNFTIVVENDLKSGEILTKIDEYVKKTLEIHSSLVVVILSHGFEGTIYGSNSIPVEIRAIKETLCAEKLKEKPKILIIQACQSNEGFSDRRLAKDGANVADLANLLIAWSTVEGYTSIRDTTQGTWFIQTLCSKIRELHGEEHLMDILTRVTNEVGAKEGGCGERMVPKTESTLKKNFYLPPLDL